MENRPATANDSSGDRSMQESGFGLFELLISSTVLLIVCAGVFTCLRDVQRAAVRQADVREVQENLFVGLDLVERFLRQAGNDPWEIGFAPVTILSPAEIRVKSDLTGSAGPSQADKGDPDGDTLDSAEDVILRYNSSRKSIEWIPTGGSPQSLAQNIESLQFDYLDANGHQTGVGPLVRAVRVTVKGVSGSPNPTIMIRLDTHIYLEAPPK